MGVLTHRAVFRILISEPVRMAPLVRLSTRSMLVPIVLLTVLFVGVPSFVEVATGASPMQRNPAILLVTPVTGPLSGSRTFHWYAGGVYHGSTTTATVVMSQIKIPTGTLKTNQFYYVILSIWDNTGSYDQIGFANNNGVWGLAYSYTMGMSPSPGCSGTITYHYSPNAVPLNAGTTYNFSISINAGVVSFDAWNYNIHVFHLTTSNGATSFSVGALYCGYYGYTVYEEAYMPKAAAVPNHSFLWSSNLYFNPGGVFPGWTAFRTAQTPAVVLATIEGNKVLISN
jgi:hypothetical protein